MYFIYVLPVKQRNKYSTSAGLSSTAFIGAFNILFNISQMFAYTLNPLYILLKKETGKQF